MTDYGRELDFSGGGNTDCPPDDIYTFVVADITDPTENKGFNEGEVDIQVVLDCKIDNYPYDPDDEEDYDWNGTSVRHYLVLGRRYPQKDKDKNLITNPDGSYVLSDPSPVWKSDHVNAKHRKVVEAIFPEWDWSKEGLKDRKIILDDFIGRKFRASLAANDKGYARLSNFVKAGRSGKSKPAPVVPQQQLQQALEPDDPDVADDNLLEDES